MSLRRATAASAAVVLLGAAPAAVAPEGRLPPRPVEVTADGGGADGVVGFQPPLVLLPAEPGTSTQPELVLANRTDAAVSATLDVAGVVAGESGAPVVADGGRPAASAAPWVTLPTDEVHLAPGEQARLWPTVTVPAGVGVGTRLAAVRATVADEAVLAAFLAVRVGDPPPADLDATAGVRRVTAGRGEAYVTVRGPEGEAAAFAGRLTVRGWWGGTVIDTPIPAVLVLPGSERTQAVTFTLPAVPGPYRVVASFRALDGGEGTAAGSGWLVGPLAAVAAVAAVVVVAGLAVVAARRRWDRRG